MSDGRSQGRDLHLAVAQVREGQRDAGVGLYKVQWTGSQLQGPGQRETGPEVIFLSLKDTENIPTNSVQSSKGLFTVCLINFITKSSSGKL